MSVIKDVLTKAQMASLSEQELRNRIAVTAAYVMGLQKGYGYSNMQYDCVRSSASGEMGNMFVFMRKYNIGSEAWNRIIVDMKADDPEKMAHFYESVRRLWRFEGEAHRRFWVKWKEEQDKKNVCKECNGDGIVEDYADSAGYGGSPAFVSCSTCGGKKNQQLV